MNMRSIMPSVTLPCHMSIFHSVCAERHGILTNTYVPQVRPVNGICETLAAAGKKCAFFYTWEPLKDLARPLSLARTNYYNGKIYSYHTADKLVTEDAVNMLKNGDLPDFIFFYQCQADEAGHKYSWMSGEYLDAVNASLDNVQRVVNLLPKDYKLILTADHGGHDRSHGTVSMEDMTVPIFLRHSTVTPGELRKDISLLDIAPTVTKWLDVNPDPDWEGQALL